MDGDAKAVLIGLFIIVVAIVAFAWVFAYNDVKSGELRNLAYVACIAEHSPAECKLARP